MTPRESFIAALEGSVPSGRVPHFELEFFLTMEAFGRVHPSQRHYDQWSQMSRREQDLHRRDVTDLHLAVARRYEHAGMLYHVPRGWSDEDIRLSIDEVREMSGMEYLVTLHGDATYAIPDGDGLVEFVMEITDNPAEVKAEAIGEWGTIDDFCLCSDYCFNDNPFLSPDMFDELIAPYLNRLVAGYREMGFYVIKHTDGNIMPILDRLVAAKPHALHSIDPQGGVDLAELKRGIGDQLCLIGNVNCALMQTGSEEDFEADVRRALREGMPGGGYVFSTSNCIYTGLALERYERMLEIWREVGEYGSVKSSMESI